MKSKTFKKALALTLSLAMIICSLATFGGVVATAESTLPTTLQNGDFESGTTGWSITPSTSETSGEGAFNIVNAAQNEAHKINITGNAGCFVTAHTSTWLYQGVTLEAGTYTWEYHIDLYGTYIMTGAYTSIGGFGTEASLIKADTFTATKDDGTVSTAFKFGTGDYRFGGSSGNWNFTVVYEFTLTEKTDVYFAIRGSAGNYHYIDNMTLVKEPGVAGTIFQNGDFENGTAGWSVTPSTGANEGSFSIVNAAQAEAHKINIDGNAGCFVTGHTSTWLYQGVTLEAGKYKWEYHIDLYGTYIITGAYTSIDGIGTANALIKADNFVATKDDGTVSSSFKLGTGDYRFGGSSGNWNFTVVYEFTLTEKTDVYFAIRGSAGNYHYIDNMTLIGDKLLNGDFETGDLSGFLNASGSAIKVVNTAQVEGDATTFSGYAAYMPGGAANTANTLLQAVKLPAGSYVWKFDTDLIITKSGWSFLFGVYTNLKNTGVGYGSGSSIGTANGVNNKTGKALSVPATGQNGFYISAGLQTIDATIEVKFTLEAETVVYLDIRTSANGHSYIDNMTLETSKTLDTTLYDFDENGQFDDSFVVSDSNQASENLKVEVIDSEEAEYNNVLKLPKYDNTDRGATARFYKMLDGLIVGTTYKVSFDLKFADYTADKVSDWIALTGVSSTKDRPLNLVSGADIITYSAGTLGNINKLPAKVVTYTSNDNDYTVAANENGRNAIIMWNGGRDWATYTMEFVAESEEYFFYIENYLAKTDLYVDNIQFALSDEQLDTGLDKTVIQDETVPSVLIIGNSFAGDTFREFENILNASSENKLRVGKYGKGAQSPQYFANQINNGSLGADFCYAEKGYTGNSTLSDAVSFDNVLELTDWDYVLIQTTTISYNETFEGYTVELVNALVAKGFEKSQIYLYIPWNARQDYLDRNGNFTSTATQKTALDNYVATLEANENLSDCNIMSVHNEIYDLQKFIVNIHRGTYGVSDGLHLNRIGQTAVSMTLFHKLTGVDVTDSSVFDYSNLDFTDSSWADNDGGVITQIQLDALKVIANGEAPVVEYGDANYDGDIDVRDLVRGKKLIADEKYTIGADCVEDEELNSEDLTLLRQWLLGIKEEVNSLNLEG